MRQMDWISSHTLTVSWHALRTRRRDWQLRTVSFLAQLFRPDPSEAQRGFMADTDSEMGERLGHFWGVLAVGLLCALAGFILEQIIWAQTVL